MPVINRRIGSRRSRVYRQVVYDRKEETMPLAPSIKAAIASRRPRRADYYIQHGRFNRDFCFRYWRRLESGILSADWKRLFLEVPKPARATV